MPRQAAVAARAAIEALKRGRAPAPPAATAGPRRRQLAARARFRGTRRPPRLLRRPPSTRATGRGRHGVKRRRAPRRCSPSTGSKGRSTGYWSWRGRAGSTWPGCRSRRWPTPSPPRWRTRTRRERRDQLGRDVFRRSQAVDTIAIKAGRACLVAIRLPDDATERYRVPQPPFWSPADAAARIRALLPEIGEGGVPLEALLPGMPAAVSDRAGRCREAVASTFGAGLEMARGGDLTLDQEAAWAPIQVRRGQDPSSDTGGLAA